MAEFAVKVMNLRPGGPRVPAFFNLAFGYKDKHGEFVPLMVARDFVVKRATSGEYFFKPPAEKRVRNGEVQKDRNGYDIWDPYIDLYGEKGAGGTPDKWSPTKAAFALRKHILEQVAEGMKTLEAQNVGRGGARAAAPAGVATAIDGPDTDLDDLFGASSDLGDEDIPF